MASSRLKPVLRTALRVSSQFHYRFHAPRGPAAEHRCGTGFSREGVGYRTPKLRVNAMASSRLKPVPLKASRVSSGVSCSLAKACFMFSSD